MRVRLMQLAWLLLFGVGVIPTLAISKYSLLTAHWPGVLAVATHVSAVGIAFCGVSPKHWRAAPYADLLPRRAARVARVTTLRWVLLLEAAILCSPAPVRTLWTGAPLRWGWPATLSVAMLLIAVALERILRAELYALQRLTAADATEG